MAPAQQEIAALRNELAVVQQAMREQEQRNNQEKMEANNTVLPQNILLIINPFQDFLIETKRFATNPIKRQDQRSL